MITKSSNLVNFVDNTVEPRNREPGKSGNPENREEFPRNVIFSLYFISQIGNGSRIIGNRFSLKEVRNDFKNPYDELKIQTTVDKNEHLVLTNTKPAICSVLPDV